MRAYTDISNNNNFATKDHACHNLKDIIRDKGPVLLNEGKHSRVVIMNIIGYNNIMQKVNNDGIIKIIKIMTK